MHLLWTWYLFQFPETTGFYFPSAHVAYISGSVNSHQARMPNLRSHPIANFLHCILVWLNKFIDYTQFIRNGTTVIQITTDRPVSIPCILCKLMEHVKFTHIRSHLDRHGIINPEKHGFCSNHVRHSSLDSPTKTTERPKTSSRCYHPWLFKHLQFNICSLLCSFKGYFVNWNYISLLGNLHLSNNLRIIFAKRGIC